MRVRDDLRRLAIMAPLLVGFSGCAGNEGKITLPKAESKQVERTVSVPIAPLSVVEVSVPVQATGTTQPVRTSELAPQVSARVNAVLVREGERVKQGAPLVRLDPAEAKLMAAQATANAASTTAQAKQVASDLARLTPLAERGTVPKQRVDQLASQRDALEAASEAAHVAAQQARRDVTETLVRAPFGGVVSTISVEAGEMAVKTPPTILLRLVDLSEIEVRIPVHERDLSRIAVGDTAHVSVPSADKEITAKVSYIRPEIDVHTRSAEVVVRFDNEAYQLLAGMFARVRIDPARTRDSLVVAQSAIGRAGDERFLYVVEQGHAHRRKVEVQTIDETRAEVLGGARPGEEVVISGLDRLSEGVAVQAQTAHVAKGDMAAPSADTRAEPTPDTAEPGASTVAGSVQ